MDGSVAIIFICAFILLIILRIWFSSPTNIGKYGEKRVARKLDGLPEEYITLNDVLLPTSYGTTQIDHIVVSTYGIFVIETKNYKGWIFGNEKSEMWTQSLYGRKVFGIWSSEQHKFRNPIRQNIAHTIAVKSILKDIGDFKIIPMVVFSNDAELNITTPNNIVINWSELRSTIQEYDYPCIFGNEIDLIVEKISSANQIDEESRNAHTQNIQAKVQSHYNSIENNICPKCGGTLVERNGKYGTFLGCSNYPKCHFTYNN